MPNQRSTHVLRCSTLLCCQVSTLEDMRRFILEHSDFSRAQANVTKHVNIVTQLSEVVATRSLMDVSTVRMWGLLAAYQGKFLRFVCVRACVGGWVGFGGGVEGGVLWNAHVATVHCDAADAAGSEQPQCDGLSMKWRVKQAPVHGHAHCVAQQSIDTLGCTADWRRPVTSICMQASVSADEEVLRGRPACCFFAPCSLSRTCPTQLHR
jgi:hypothetical protein